MHLTTRNVNTAFAELVRGIHTGTVPTDVRPSRNGEVLRLTEPLLLTYTHPRERVLLNAARDANPFFHLYEALWMLAGRSDLAPVRYYCGRMADYSDDGKTLNGAYGARWRHHGAPPPRRREGVDQLDRIVAHLTAHPWSRRAVLQMWTAEDDLLCVDDGKDSCCNLTALFDVGPGMCPQCEGRAVTNGWPEPCTRCGGKPHDVPRTLNMTVTNRSNDLTWGLLGANAVHFSFLQEYLAARLGLDVGVYYHFSNNVHAYTARWTPEKWLLREGHAGTNPYSYDPTWDLVPLVKDSVVFERELPEFVERHARDATARAYQEPFLQTVAQPLCAAWHHYKRRQLESAFDAANQCRADDWRYAAVAWLGRRLKRRGGKEATRARE